MPQVDGRIKPVEKLPQSFPDFSGGILAEFPCEISFPVFRVMALSSFGFPLQ
jgi:hypothetical protein